MKTQTTKAAKTNASELRERATAAIAAALEADAKVDAARKELTRIRPNGYSGTDELACIVAEIAKLEAEDASVAAKAAASSALDAAEHAECDPLALACDVTQLHADLDAAIAEEARLAGEYAAAQKRIQSCIDSARDAHKKLAARRSEAGQPAPVPLPRRPSAFGGEPPKDLLAALASYVKDGPAAPSTNDAKIRQLRIEERKRIVARELALREREEEAARKAAVAKSDAEARVAQQKRWAEQHEAALAKQAAERAKEDALVDAHRARTAP